MPSEDEAQATTRHSGTILQVSQTSGKNSMPEKLFILPQRRNFGWHIRICFLTGLLCFFMDPVLGQ